MIATKVGHDVINRDAATDDLIGEPIRILVSQLCDKLSPAGGLCGVDGASVEPAQTEVPALHVVTGSWISKTLETATHPITTLLEGGQLSGPPRYGAWEGGLAWGGYLRTDLKIRSDGSGIGLNFRKVGGSRWLVTIKVLKRLQEDRPVGPGGIEAGRSHRGRGSARPKRKVEHSVVAVCPAHPDFPCSEEVPRPG